MRVEQPWSGYALSRETWDWPMNRRDPVMIRLLEPQADAAVRELEAGTTLVGLVRRAQANALPEGDAGIHAVARTLAMAPRTLQRRLASEGTSYHALLDDVRRELAESQLRAARFSIGEITFMLGYSEPAAFHRAFKRWNGVTPQAFRSASRAR